MNQWLAIFLVVAVGCVQAGDDPPGGPDAGTPCSESWYRQVEQRVPTGDGQGHGPDIGSGEWKSAVEFKLGLRGAPDLPQHDSDAWCRHIDRIVFANGASPASDGGSGETTAAHGPSYACDKVRAGSIEAMICDDAELSALDRKLAVVNAEASQKAVDERPVLRKREQRAWIRGRNACRKSSDRCACVRDAYARRIAELQARYRLVPATGPVRFVCEGSPASEVVVSFFQTEPPTLVAERGGAKSLMFLQPSASGAKYQGRNETFWEHQGEASMSWGQDAPALRCTKAPWGG